MTSLAGVNDEVMPYAREAAVQWAALIPDIDALSVEVSVGLVRVGSSLEMAQEQALTDFTDRGVQSLEQWQLLAFLRREHMHDLSTVEVAERLGRSWLAVSNETIGLLRAGLTVYSHSEDLNGGAVRISDKGISLADEIMLHIQRSVHTACTAVLSHGEKRQLAELLGKLSSAF